MTRIVVLDAVTAGRIAAGEVVERPASVAKELVENAFDAGATRVEVELSDGGRSLLKVVDNGEGMDTEDAVLAFERHATSKLGRAEDLERVGTYGFRGEALPSIGAVGRVRLLTCRPGAGEGTEVVYEGGRLVASGPGPAREGTVVEVRDLFFNTPARREAMRSAAAETARISEVVGTLALACPGVAVSLVAGGQLLWATPGSGRLEDAAVSLLGPAFVRQAAVVDWGRAGPVLVWGLAGLPGAARRDGKRQYLFCNGRPIGPRLLHAALDEAYRGLLEAGRTPVFVLHLEMAPETVDVNIHPAKTYVRFRDHGQVHRAVLGALREALGRADLFAGRLSRRLGGAVAEEAAGLEGMGGGARAGARDAATGLVPTDWRDLFARGPGTWPASDGARLGGVAPGGATTSGAGGGEVPFDRLEPLGQVGEAFIAAAGPDGLYLVDQHAADERVAFERLLTSGATGSLATQALAVPVTLELAPGEEAVLEASLPFLREVGFELEPFGPRAVLIRAVPAVLSGAPPGRLLEDYIDRLGRERGVSSAGSPAPGDSGGTGRAARGDGLAAFDRVRAARTLAACRSACKAGDRLSPAEMRALFVALAACEEPRTCPHGRPTALRFGTEELRRAFGRGSEAR